MIDEMTDWGWRSCKNPIKLGSELLFKESHAVAAVLAAARQSLRSGLRSASASIDESIRDVGCCDETTCGAATDSPASESSAVAARSLSRGDACARRKSRRR
jgi:hypothetical protein